MSADAVMLRPMTNEDVEQRKREKATACLSEFDDTHWKDLMVPGDWGMINEYSNYTGKEWYHKKFANNNLQI